MDKVLGIFLSVLGIVGCTFGIVMTIMAIQHHELGRVLLYGMITLFSIELFIPAILKLKKKP